MQRIASRDEQASTKNRSGRRLTRRRAWNGWPFGLLGLGLLCGSALLYAQKGRTASSALSMTVGEQELLQNLGSVNVLVKIRLTRGVTASLWGDSSNACTSAINSSKIITASGTYTIPFAQIPFGSKSYVCLLSADGKLRDSIAWPAGAGAAAKLVFTTSPSNSTGGTVFGTQPVVTAQDSSGNMVTDDNADQVTLVIGTNPSGGTLACTPNPVTVSSGVATFAGCKIDRAGNGYTLKATSGSLTQAISSSFNISVGPAAQLVFTGQPGGGTGGTAWTQQPQLAVQDAGGNTVASSSAPITLAIKSGTGTTGATLTCAANPLNASSGVATFAACKIDKSGTSYQLHAASGPLAAADSAPFNITVGTAVQLAFTTQPGGGTGGTVWTQQPQLAVQDAGGNTVATSSAPITLAIKSGTGTTGAALTCTANPLNASSGTAAFAGCKIDKSGSNYQLHASSGSLMAADSVSFNISVGQPAQLFFMASPASCSRSGAPCTPQPLVAVLDAGGNTVTSDSTDTVKLTSSSQVLTCNANPTKVSSGVATFAGCYYTHKASGETLKATSPTGPSLSPAISAPFNIN